MKPGTLLSLLCFTLILVSSSQAFDWKHAGFVLGGGFGTFNLPCEDDDEHTSFHTSVGWGFSPDTLKHGWFHSDIVVAEFFGAGVMFHKTLAFISWYHHFNYFDSTIEVRGSYFVGVGVGKFDWDFRGQQIWESPYSAMVAVGWNLACIELKGYLIHIENRGGKLGDHEDIHLGFNMGVLIF